MTMKRDSWLPANAPRLSKAGNFACDEWLHSAHIVDVSLASGETMHRKKETVRGLSENAETTERRPSTTCSLYLPLFPSSRKETIPHAIDGSRDDVLLPFHLLVPFSVLVPPATTTTARQTIYGEDRNRGNH